jgi:hypothetical protein
MIINNVAPLKLLANNIVTIAVAMFMAFWLSACGISSPSTVPTPIQIDNSKQTATAIDPLTYQDCVYPPDEIVQACTAQGGEILKMGRAQCHQCILSYADAGKVCKDSADCQGACETKGEFVNAGLGNQVGQCASNNDPFGCRQVLEKGVAQSAICVD